MFGLVGGCMHDNGWNRSGWSFWIPFSRSLFFNDSAYVSLFFFLVRHRMYNGVQIEYFMHPIFVHVPFIRKTGQLLG